MEKSSAYILSGILLDVVALSVIKTMAQVVSIPDLVFIRSLFSLLLLAGLFRIAPNRHPWIKEETLYVLVRGFTGVLSLICLILSLEFLPLYFAVSLLYTAPIFAIISAWLIYPTSIQPNQIVGMFFSLIGCTLFCVSGSQFTLELPVLWGVFAAMLYGVSLASTKRTPQTSSIHMQFTYNIMCLLAIIPFIDISQLLQTQPSSLSIIGASALLNLAMNHCYICGYKAGDIISLSILEYFSIPLGAFIGFLIWKDIPETPEVMAGGFIIVGGIIANSKRKRKTLPS